MKALLLALALILTGCAPLMWTKPGATQQEFASDRYDCLQGSQQRYSEATVNGYGGQAQSAVITNGGLFRACMEARGYALVRQAN